VVRARDRERKFGQPMDFIALHRSPYFFLLVNRQVGEPKLRRNFLSFTQALSNVGNFRQRQ
jgi:hypothetical protein